MKQLKRVKNLMHKYRHAWVFLYGFIYLPWFLYLEKHVTSQYYLVHSTIDDYIPFVEYFIVPYLLWFLFVSGFVLYFFFTDVPAFYKLVTFLFTGMTLFLIVCTLFPNGLALRPATFARDNIFVDMVKMLYATDTSTNVLPSIHVYNTIGICIAVSRSKKLQQHKIINTGTYLLAALIILSTMFLKQHSVVDVMTASIMAYALYHVVYVTEPKFAPQLTKQTS
ncbi:MAG: phosphatase PAP2 family protein [Hespellia sp.]|nr:phosphatase PAP2 family protein [Hespellia sp.]